MQLNIYNPVNSRDNTCVIVSNYLELQGTIKKIVGDMKPVEACSMQFTMIAQNGLPPFIFGVKKGNYQPNHQDIIRLGANNKYVRQISCENKDCTYPVITNFPRKLSRHLHSVVPIQRQTTLMYGQPTYPVYDEETLDKPVVNDGDPLSVVFERMQKELVASK